MTSSTVVFQAFALILVIKLIYGNPLGSLTNYRHSCVEDHENFCGEHGECNMEEDYCQCDREYEGHKCQKLRLVRCSRTVIDHVVNEVKCPDGLYCAYSNINCYFTQCKLAKGYCLPLEKEKDE